MFDLEKCANYINKELNKVKDEDGHIKKKVMLSALVLVLYTDTDFQSNAEMLKIVDKIEQNDPGVLKIINEEFLATPPKPELTQLIELLAKIPYYTEKIKERVKFAPLVDPNNADQVLEHPENLEGASKRGHLSRKDILDDEPDENSKPDLLFQIYSRKSHHKNMLYSLGIDEKNYTTFTRTFESLYMDKSLNPQQRKDKLAYTIMPLVVASKSVEPKDRYKKAFEIADYVSEVYLNKLSQKKASSWAFQQNLDRKTAEGERDKLVLIDQLYQEATKKIESSNPTISAEEKINLKEKASSLNALIKSQLDACYEKAKIKNNDKPLTAQQLINAHQSAFPEAKKAPLSFEYITSIEKFLKEKQGELPKSTLANPKKC
jgi:hypothetical protein